MKSRQREERPPIIVTSSDPSMEGEPVSAVMKRSTDELVSNLLASDTPTVALSRDTRSKEQVLKDKINSLSRVAITSKVHIQPGI